jgi:hypothetical protein
MTMMWTTVTDENGHDFHAQMDNLNPEEAWVYFNKENGFGKNVGEIALIDRLKQLPDGKYGR